MTISGNDDASSDETRDPSETVIREPKHGTIKGQNTTQYSVDPPKDV
jgi:hypothetical protein